MKIAILSNNPNLVSTSRLVEEASKRGHEVEVIRYRDCYLTLDDKHPYVFYEGRKLTDYDAIIPRISNTMTKYGCAVVRQFEMQGIWTLSSSISIARSRDKLRAAQILAKAGIDMPKTLVSRSPADIDILLEQLELPVVIKLATGTHGNGVVLAETKNSTFTMTMAPTSSCRNILRNLQGLTSEPLWWVARWWLQCNANL